MSGTLYLVATPIGNLEDLSPRAARILKAAHWVCCEDTRHTGKLLRHIDAHPRTLSVHEHNERDRVDFVLKELRAGRDVALVSDAGTPGVSDPGFVLVRALREAGLNVVSVPGPSAAVTALSASGLPTDRFVFHGFPPEQAGRQDRFFEEAARLPMTGVFYLSPHKAAKQLTRMAGFFGERKAVLARELTKLYEEYRTSTVSELARELAKEKPRGELTLVVAGNDDEKPSAGDAEALLAALRAEGLSGRSLAEALQGALGLRKKEAYRLALREDGVRESAGEDGEDGR